MFIAKTSVVKLRQNLTSLWCVVITNVVFYLLNSRATLSFINPTIVEQLGLNTTKVLKPIKNVIDTRQHKTNSQGGVGCQVGMKCGAKFENNFMVCELNKFEANHGQHFSQHLPYWYFAKWLLVENRISRLIDKSINLNIKY
jgi:hypothetical protein